MEELFRLRDGRVILDEDISEKMFTIKGMKPDERDPNSSGYEWNDYGMACLFAELYRNEARYCSEHKCWYTYHDGAWRRDEGGILVGEKLKDFVRLMILYCGEIEDDDRRKVYTTFINKMGDQRMRARILKDACGEMRIEAAQFDADPYLINCTNGTYNLRTFEFYEHKASDFLTMQTNFRHTVDRSVKCERWEQFILEVCSGDKDKADYLQRALGYSLLGKNPEACMFILWGKTTRNGKSTLLGTIERMMGSYASVAPVGLICKDRSSGSGGAEGATPFLAGLKGKRFVTMAESNEYGKLDEEKIKQYTGGEEISSRALYQAAVSWVPQFTLWLSCNDLPAVTDKSLFASERVRVIEFSRHFSQQEQDKSLAETFETDAARKGIFMWLIRGYIRYLDRGLTMPDKMRRVIRQYERDNDLVLQFLEACCEHGDWNDDSIRVRTTDLFAKYRQWCSTEFVKPMRRDKFFAEVERHMDWTMGRVRINGYDYFKGLQLKQIL